MEKLYAIILLSILVVFISGTSLSAEVKILDQENVDLGKYGIPSIADAEGNDVAYSRCSSNSVIAGSDETQTVVVRSIATNQSSEYETDVPCGEDVGIRITSDYLYLENENKLRYLDRAEDSSFQDFITDEEYFVEKNSVLLWNERTLYTSPEAESFEVNLTDISKADIKDAFTGLLVYHNEADYSFDSIERSNAKCFVRNLRTGETTYFENKCVSGENNKVLISGGKLYNAQNSNIRDLENFSQICSEKMTATGTWGTDGEEVCYYDFKDQKKYFSPLAEQSNSRLAHWDTYLNRDEMLMQDHNSGKVIKFYTTSVTSSNLQEKRGLPDSGTESSSDTSLWTILGSLALLALLGLASKAALSAASGGVGGKSSKNKEYKRTCNKCGKNWYVSQRELDKLKKNKKTNSIAGAALALGGNLSASAMSNRNKGAAEEQLRELEKCPECGSQDYEEEVEEV